MKRMKFYGLVSCLAVCAQADGQSGTIATVAGGGTFIFPSNVTVALNAPLGGVDGVAVDAQGNVYVADGSDHRIFLVSPTGGIQIFAGNGTLGFSGDGGPATSASLSPGGLALDTSGNLFFADASNRIRKVSANGVITTVAGNGSQPQFPGERASWHPGGQPIRSPRPSCEILWRLLLRVSVDLIRPMTREHNREK